MVCIVLLIWIAFTPQPRPFLNVLTTPKSVAFYTEYGLYSIGNILRHAAVSQIARIVIVRVSIDVIYNKTSWAFSNKSMRNYFM